MIAFDKESSQAASDAALVTQISRTDPVLQLDEDEQMVSALLPPVDMEKYIPKILPQSSHVRNFALLQKLLPLRYE